MRDSSKILAPTDDEALATFSLLSRLEGIIPPPRCAPTNSSSSAISDLVVRWQSEERAPTPPCKRRIVLRAHMVYWVIRSLGNPHQRPACEGGVALRLPPHYMVAARFSHAHSEGHEETGNTVASCADAFARRGGNVFRHGGHLSEGASFSRKGAA